MILRCPVCGKEASNGAFKKTYVSDWNKKEYKLYHCEGCDLEWWEPLKIEKEFYEEEGDEAYTIFHLGIGESLGEDYKAFFKHIPLKSGRLLDVGCGDGRFLKRAQEMGFEVWGIDFDRKSVEVCREKRGLKNVYAMSLEEFVNFAEKEGLKFDVITFFAVLEHQDKPKEFLENVKRLLKPGGFIAGDVPNRERLILWERENSDFPPHHFLWFNKKALYQALELTGFSSIKVIRVKHELKTIPAYLEGVLLGGIGLRLKKTLKKSVVKDEKLASLGVEDLKKVNPDKKLYFLSLLRKARDVFFFLPAVAYWFFVPQDKGLFYTFKRGFKNEFS
ncbi:hypothetical protein THC_1201 [Caldimicrobium thiodismutans]|uniref:Methyltransferase type 11 n=1 Tax=Caldimicrobium thiodismutans TaxID=1653476 RepID=A0A0U5AND3_9BACT|nr:class I SAM-dependent methyltransferase [Caldimicrobium thiodismutans]BAU23572.1 hypothetical protein THC_1201 [Caldimicrobium thiodismutans]